jgi:transcription termination/antitermination protein NusG
MEAENNVHMDEIDERADTVDDGARDDDTPRHAAAESAPDDEAVEPIPPVHPSAAAHQGSARNWYIIHTYSGFENKVAESLRTRADAFGFADKIGQILIPTEEVVELRNGKKVTSKRLVYPGYVLVEMEMNDELWHAVKNTPRVTGFVGGGTTPTPLSADEVNSILYRQASSAERPRPKMTFEKNDNVRIIDGPFASFSGKVDEVNTDRGTLRVMVTIFGRATPVELEFLQVEKT